MAKSLRGLDEHIHLDHNYIIFSLGKIQLTKEILETLTGRYFWTVYRLDLGVLKG